MSNDDLDLENLVGAYLAGAALILTGSSLLRMAVLRTSGSKMYLFPILNITMFVDEIVMPLNILSSTNILGLEWNNWTTFINNLCYLISKPLLLYLAYLRCRSVYTPYRKYWYIHMFMVGFRAVELFILLVINLFDNVTCDGSYDNNVCTPTFYAWHVRDGLAPLFRFYYIISEGIFYVKLFGTLKKIYSSEQPNIVVLRYRTYQTLLFSVDLSILSAMSIYRIFYLTSNVPSYTYVELFSTAFTVYVMTEFGLVIPELFKSNTRGSGDTGVIQVAPPPNGPELPSADSAVINRPKTVYTPSVYSQFSSNIELMHHGSTFELIVRDQKQ